MKPYRRLAMAIILIFMSITLPSCKKECQKEYMNNATIIGYDLRLCVCCGGYQITIENVPNPSGSSFFLAPQFPPEFVLDQNPAYPIPIKINWEIDKERCNGNFIKILSITKR